MANFNYAINAESVIKVYDNEGAYNTLLEMMSRKEQITVKFYSGKDNVPCAWIESKRIAGFKFQLKTSSFHGLLNYLCNGIVADFDNNPTEFDTIQEGEDFQLKVMEMLITLGKTIQFVPTFRERTETISGILPCFKGKVMFRIKRTEEVLNYLRENNQIL
jgi:hypothetical protein